MTSRTVLISGAGVAGSTLAYWLARDGFRTTVVERSRGLRSSGNPVDVRGPALPVAEAMGIVDRLREAATSATAVRIVDRAGRQIARLPLPAGRSAAGNAEVELPRSDLATILAGAAAGAAEYLFDDEIVALQQDRGGVDVTFERAPARRFDLVVGADGLHSGVRRLVFGPEREFVRHLGMYVATMPLGEPVDHLGDVLLYNTPGRLLSVHPSRERAMVAFIFRGGTIDGLDHRDAEQHKRIVTRAYADAGWRAPELLRRLQDTSDPYFDSVSRVRLDSWSRGRIALVGDAASCVSLFGDGSSRAMAGARTLASALADADDYATALRRYEREHRLLTEPKRRGVGAVSRLLVPRTHIGLVVRNTGARVGGALARLQRDRRRVAAGR